MWGQKHLNKHFVFFVYFFALVLLVSCDNQPGFLDAARKGQTPDIPTTMDIPLDLQPELGSTDSNPQSQTASQPEPEIENEITSPETAHTTKPEEETTAPAISKPEAPVVIAPRPAQPSHPQPVQPQPSNTLALQTPQFIKVANYVVNNEAQKVGTACNHYLMRVLELSGFRRGQFLANSFDDYARENFSSVRTEDFSTLNPNEKSRLKRHIWSYPARTPFILQWQTNTRNGHLAIIERIGDKLVVYQASLNKQLPNKKQTTIDILMVYVPNSKISVYSQFQP